MKWRVGLLSLFVVVLLLAGDHGIPPRAVNEYASHVTVSGITLAASVVPPDQVKKLFSKDLTHAGYIVVEVGVFPESGGTADFSSDEFTLRVGTDANIVQAQTPRSVAGGEKAPVTASKTIPPQLPGNIQVYNTTTVGYESGGYGRKGGVYTATGVGVGVGGGGVGPAPDPRGCDPSGADPRTGRYPNSYPGCSPAPGPPTASTKAPKDNPGLQQELEEKALPEGKTALAVAGYLYFTRPPTKQKNPDYHLSWYRVGGEARLTLPAPK
jgi:hypothetical protein